MAGRRIKKVMYHLVAQTFRPKKNGKINSSLNADEKTGKTDGFGAETNQLANE